MSNICHSQLLLLLPVMIVFPREVQNQFDPHFTSPEVSGIVHLQEWLYVDIQQECPLLRESGYGAVQISPVNEVRVLPGRSWRECLEPISYTINGRSGGESQLRAMVKACNDAGVRVLVEVVLNNMAGGTGEITGTAGSRAYPETRGYPVVSYSDEDFNSACAIDDPEDAQQVRNCQLDGFPDLKLDLPHVRGKITGFMNRLIEMGVAGFFLHAAKNMWPQDLMAIYSALIDLNPAHGFPGGSRPFFYLDVKDMDSGAVRASEYTGLGFVTEYRYAYDLGTVVFKREPLSRMVHTGTRLGYLPREQSLVFVDSPELQRYPKRNGNMSIAHFKYIRLCKIALVFMLAHPYGMPRITSSYRFETNDEGPPSDSAGKITPVESDEVTGQCDGAWICEHRWSVIWRMLAFRRETAGLPISNWSDNRQDQVAFCRGKVGFVAINAELSIHFKGKVITCLEPGRYCEVLSGGLVDGVCVGTEVLVDDAGRADIFIPFHAKEPFVVLLASAKLPE